MTVSSYFSGLTPGIIAWMVSWKAMASGTVSAAVRAADGERLWSLELDGGD